MNQIHLRMGNGACKIFNGMENVSSAKQGGGTAAAPAAVATATAMATVPSAKLDRSGCMH